jgi:hypothetical protein
MGERSAAAKGIIMNRARVGVGAIAVALAAGGASGALAPFPGTIVVSDQTSGTLRQYDAASGQLVGSVVALSNMSARTHGITNFNGELYGYVSIGATTEYFGRIDPATGAVTPLSSGNLIRFNALATLDGTFVALGSDWNVYRFSSQGDLVSTTLLNDFGGWNQYQTGGLACDGGTYLTSTTSVEQVKFWSLNGQGSTQRSLNAVSSIHGVEYESATGRAWTVSSDGSFTSVRMFEPATPTQVWSATFNGFGTDAAYFPIPAPGGVVAGLAIAFITTRRRR